MMNEGVVARLLTNSWMLLAGELTLFTASPPPHVTHAPPFSSLPSLSLPPLSTLTDS